ncbi:MAG: peptidoglycan-binding protein [Bacteroidota bacterium]
MKRSTLLALAFIFTAAFPLVSRGQSTLKDLVPDDDNPIAGDSAAPQRIGLPPAQIEFSENQTRSLTGYCFDQYLIAPRRVTNFQHVLSGNRDAEVHTASGKTMTLSDAIAKGAVAIKAVQLQVMFQNRLNEPMSITLKHPAVLWDRDGGEVNQQALNVLESDNHNSEWRQQAIWRITTAERQLKLLGYYDGSVWNIDRDRFHAAAAAFQRENGIEENGELDNGTIVRLVSNEGELRDRLGKLGFRDREGNSLFEDPAAQIRAYQRYAGTKPNGRWNKDLSSRLAVDERIVPQLNALRSDGRPMADALKDSPSRSDILTYLNARGGMMALVETPQGIELWGRRGGSYQFQGRGTDAVKRMDEAAYALSVRATKDNRVVIYPRLGDDHTMIVAIGDRNISVDAGRLAAFLNGGKIPDELANAMAPLLPKGSVLTGGGSAATVIVYRGPLVQGKQVDGKSLLQRSGVNQVDGARLAQALDRTYGDRADLYLSDDLRIGATRLRGATDQGAGMVGTGSAVGDGAAR